MTKTEEILTKQEIFVKYATKFRGENILTEPSAMASMEEYHNQFQVKLPTDEIIAEKYPLEISYKDGFRIKNERTITNELRIEGAKWMRDLIKNQLENKE